MSDATFSPEELVSIHRRLFEGVLEFAGRIRDYDITKNEWVLNGDTVRYGSSYRLMEMLAFDLKQEREFSYVGLAEAEIVRHIARFTSNLWQVHAFGEGNTRTTAIFIIKYLRKLGFDVTNDVFSENAWYFRNALVRANYTNLPQKVHPPTASIPPFRSQNPPCSADPIPEFYHCQISHFSRKVGSGVARIVGGG